MTPFKREKKEMVSYLILAGKAFPYNYTNLVKTGTLGREYKNLNGTIQLVSTGGWN